MSNIIKELYQVARGIPVEFSLKEDIKILEDTKKKIYREVNAIGELGLTDKIAMMLPMATAPLKEVDYFGEIFAGNPSLTHARGFAQIGYPELGDAQNVISVLFGANPKQRFLFSLKEDTKSPVGLSVNKVMLLINSEDVLKDVAHEIISALTQLGIPEGNSVSVLFTDELKYTDDEGYNQQMVMSNLIITYVLTTIAAQQPKVFTEKFNYKLSKTNGRSTYIPDEGEVLFEVHQPSDVPSTWFDIFDKADDEDFDLASELSQYINANLLELAKAK